MSTGDSDGDCEGRGSELSTGGSDLSRSICDEGRDCDEGRATASRRRQWASLVTVTTTIGVLVWFCCFGTESVLGFFFFFLINTVYCFGYVLILLCKL